MATQIAPRAPISQNFGLLPEPKGRLRSFGVSVAANFALAIFFVWFAIMQLHKEPPPPRYESTALIFQNPPPPPAKMPAVPKVPVTAPPVPAELPRTVETPRRQPEPSKPEMVKLNTAAMPALPPAPPKAVVAPPQPKVGLFSSPRPTPAANNQSAPSVQMGGFGSPAGAVVNPSAGASKLVAVGSFNAAPGAGQGAGAARQGSVQGTAFGSGVANGVPGGTSRGAVVSAGFSNGVVGGRPGAPAAAHAGVATGAFGVPGSGAPVVQTAKAQTTIFVAPEVISEPRPQYTEEARQLKIQGQVTLQVRFGADGKVEVLRVIDRLGHGLDEQAERVAQQIHFKPAARNGQPVDHITYIHILFQLA